MRILFSLKTNVSYRIERKTTSNRITPVTAIPATGLSLTVRHDPHVIGPLAAHTPPRRTEVQKHETQ